MKTVAIIVEYNPFHNGHLYQINKLKKETDADCIVVIMSGNYVQRGTPAFVDKYTRTRLALSNGVDLVFELPVYYATASAEIFAEGAINILNGLGTIDYLCFGSECGDLTLLGQIADILLMEPDFFKTILKEKLRAGLSYPIARKEALIETMLEENNQKTVSNDSTNDLTQSKNTGKLLETVLNEPNNILGIEYIKALKKSNSTIQPITILRHGSGYHEKNLDHPFCSATALRNYFESQDKQVDNIKIESFVPTTTNEMLKTGYQKYFPITVNDFTSLLYYRLQQETKESLLNYLDVTNDLANRILTDITYFENYTVLIEKIKSKQYTYTRISRTLLHILLGISKIDLNRFQQSHESYYARVLGLNVAASPFLKNMKKNGDIPIVTKVANANKILSPIALQCLTTDINATHLYNLIVYNKFQTKLLDEYQVGPIII